MYRFPVFAVLIRLCGILHPASASLPEVEPDDIRNGV
jgi:hypothetical protein